VKRALFVLFTPLLLGSCDFDHGPALHFILPNDFHGEIRVDEGVADASDPPLEQGHYTIRIPNTGLVRVESTELFSRWHHERAFSESGRELPVLSGHAEQPDVVALRALGNFNDASNNLRNTDVYVFGTWHDAEDLLNRYRENFGRQTPPP
jgi:hypothetical protein